MDNTCVCCGTVIPEGRLVCPTCERPQKRLIDANALIAEYDRIHVGEPGKARKLMEDAPTVDAVEVVHGRWNTEKCDHVPWRIKNPEKWVVYKCSVCGYSNGRKHSNYCPNCGAKMDGGNEDG